MPRRFRTFATVAGLCLAVGVMTTLVSYSVTLYRLFCQATGAFGTTERAASDTATESVRTVTVSFNTDVAPGMPWRFNPVQPSVTVHLGQESLVFFEAENLSDHPIVGHATFNVTPDRVGLYFKKIQCFCFTEERLGAHQKVEMPVDFFVDPRMATDRGRQRRAQHHVVLHVLRIAPAAGCAGPGPVRRIGRPTRRPAGSCSRRSAAPATPPTRTRSGRCWRAWWADGQAVCPGYPYSAALAQSGITWDSASLDKWLTSPQHLVPGAQMPFSLPDPVRRRDVIAYLATLAPHAAADAPKRPPG